MADFAGSGYTIENIERMVLEADQYKAELSNISKLVNAQSKAERELQTVREALEKQTDKLSSAFARVNDSLSKVGLGSAALAGGLAGLAANAIPALVGRLGDMIGAQVRAVEAADDWIDSVGEHSAAVDRMTTSAQHTIDKTEALSVARKLEIAGVKVSAEQYDGLGRAIATLTQIHGNSAEATDKVTNAVLNLQTRGLRALGIEVKRTGDIEADRLQILNKMTSTHEVVLNQMEREKALQKELKDAQLEMNIAMAKFPAIAELMTFSQETRVKNEIKWTQIVTDGWYKTTAAIETATKALQRFVGINTASIAAAQQREAGRSSDATASAKQLADLNARWKGMSDKGFKLGNVVKAGELPEIARPGDSDYEGGRADPNAFKGWGKVDRDAAESNLKAQSELELETAQIFKQEQARRKLIAAEADGVAWKNRIARAYESEDIAARRRTDSMRLEAGLLKQLSAGYEEAKGAASKLASEGLANLAVGLVDASVAAMEGKVNFGEAVFGMLKAGALSIGTSLLGQGVAAQIEATAYAMTPWTLPLAAMAQAKATTFFTGAAPFLAGGLALAGIGAAAGIGSGGSAPASSGASAGGGGGGGYRPSTPRDDDKPTKFEVSFVAGPGADPLLMQLWKDRMKISINQRPD